MNMEFERKPLESARAYAAFKEYLDLGPQRSLVKVAERLGKSKRQAERWSRRFDWSGRVLAHTEHLARLERQAIEALAVERGVEWTKVHEAVRVAEWQRHKKLIALADEMLSRWENNKDKCGTLEGIARVLELATRLARLAAGMPTEVKEVNTSVTGTIDVEWELAIRRAYGKPEPSPRNGQDGAVVDVEEVKPVEPSGSAAVPGRTALPSGPILPPLPGTEQTL